MNRKRLTILVAAITLSFLLVAATLATAYSQQALTTSHLSTGSLKSRIALQSEKDSFVAHFLSGLYPPSTRLPSDTGAWDGNGVRYPLVLQNGGNYRMWYTGLEFNGPGRVGMATSPDGINWAKSPLNPILDVGAPGAWDADGLEAPFVIREGPTTYKMWYSGFPECAIGYATSSDGVSWTKHPGNPVLTPGTESWNNMCAIHPYILFEDGLYKMWLLSIGDDGGGQVPYIAYATSADGITWDWDAANPLITRDWEGFFWRPDVLHLGGTYQMWYSAWDGEAHTSYATSPDEVTWTKFGAPVLSGTPGAWDEGFAADPFVIEDGGVFTMWYDSNTHIGMVTSTNGITWSSSLNDPVLSPGEAGVYIDVNYGHDWVEGRTRPNEMFVVTVTDGANIYTSTGQTDDNGWFGTHQWPWTPYQPFMNPGNQVQVSVGGGSAEVNPIGTINGALDFAADTVWGTVDAPWFNPDSLTVRCEVWVENGPPAIDVEGVPADGGSYFCDFSTVGWDLLLGQTVAVRYFEPDGDSVINIIENPWMRVNYGHDWVGGTYALGHTFWITVTDSGGDVKATAQVETLPGVGWGNDGFETRGEDWTPSQPDIQPDDRVYFQADDGYANLMIVGDISGTVDVENDSVGGPVFAPWFTQTLNVECHPWGAPGPAPSKNSSAEPDGTSPFLCAWDPLTEWDLLPGQEVGVMYIEPDLDRVIAPLHAPAPDVHLEKWVEGVGQSMPGGPVVYTLRFINHGDAPAATISLTDTLPISTTYLTDTSGVAPTFGSDWVAWAFGPLNPAQEIRFNLVLLNTASPGDVLHNVADLSAPLDPNGWNNHAEADVVVVDEYPNLYINKHPNPGDPTPGQTMLWEINYGNNGPVASGPVTLTDTLPLSTTVVSWISENGYDLWTDLSVSDEQLILTTPSIPGYWSDRILLHILLDPGIAIGTQLTNTIAITTPNDSDPNDNWHVRNDVWTNAPHWNGYLNKTFGWGTLIPGGEVDYNLHARNLGNMPIHAWFTDTLPAHTEFAYAWLNIGPYNYPFPPDYVDNQIAVWDLGILAPGEWRNFSIHLNIDDAALPGDTLTNCAEVAHSFPEDSPEDNVSCVSKLLTAPGPNLQIEKSYHWNWEGQLNFSIEFRNIGTTALYSVTLTDTLPAETTFNGNWWHWYWQNIAFTDLGDHLAWTISELQPGQSAGLSFDLDLNEGVIDVPGLAFTNTVEAPIPDDVNPADNISTVVPVTGPDIYVNKWLSGGLPRPGEVVTFTIEFGNQNTWPWWANGPITLTEILPPEMTFITATVPGDPNQAWPPTVLPGGELAWGWGDMCPGCWWQFDVVVQLSETVTAWEMLPNLVEVFSDNPNDLEWDYGNNATTALVTILDPQFAIAKDYAGAGIAGIPITYTLVVTNTGGWADTGILVHDLLPAYIAYTVGGDYDPLTGFIAWEIPALQPGESAEVAFSGVLACTPNVNVMNDTYQVTGSDEGITSPLGLPVAFDIAAPTMFVAFQLTPSAILPGESVSFTSQSTTNGTPIVSWEWDFGDGSLGSGETLTHVYTTPGLYDVTLTITDACGFTQTLVSTDAVTVAQTLFEMFLPVIITK
ncbi:MAG: DUF11 domain-containing protein [Anaerolineales bacterium]|nr:DUF11 domain-containing protein [Anaerolineales bacterium]